MFSSHINRLTHTVVGGWLSLGPRFLPFADVATDDLPLSRLLRLSLFQISVGMTLVLLVGTLNRVMIVELGVPASLVGIMIALPLVFAPFRAFIGFRSDVHHCALGWRRVPFIWKGTLLLFASFSIMPFALLVLAGKGESADLPMWIGFSAAALAFLLAGAGAHTVQTAGLALATDLAPQEHHPKIVGLMYVALLIGMLFSSLLFGAALEEFSPGRLVQVIQGAAIATLVLNTTAIWKQESRHSRPTHNAHTPDTSFREAWMLFCSGENVVRRLLLVGLGTMAFAMADILLEPYGGQVLMLSVSATTKLTALLAIGGLLGFALASYVLNRGIDSYQLAQSGAMIGVPAFMAIIISAPLGASWLFLVGNFLVGFGGALFAHGTLTATMMQAPSHQAGLAVGAWGSVQATAAGIAIVISAVIRDVVNGAEWASALSTGYIVVYIIEIVLLIVTILAAIPMIRKANKKQMMLRQRAS